MTKLSWKLSLLGALGLALSCAETAPPGDLPPGQEDCANGIDDDDDGDRDCRDADCEGDPACAEVCNNAQDDDLDGLFDCTDPDCAGEPGCGEICNNAQDDDADGQVDCADADCANNFNCIPDCIPAAGQDNCTNDDICVADECVPAFGRQYRFSGFSVALNTGGSFDPFGGDPDPKVEIFIDGNQILETAEKSDTFTATYTETATATLNAATVVRLVILDVDVDADDTLITCEGPFSADLLRGRDIVCENADARLDLSVNPL
jgi:hypothetical protein